MGSGQRPAAACSLLILLLQEGRRDSQGSLRRTGENSNRLWFLWTASCAKCSWIPGPVPCASLLSYLLTDVGSVIDVVGLRVSRARLGVGQLMFRRPTRHVELSLVGFGHGFEMSSSVSFGESQVWQDSPLPEPLQIANSSDVRAPVASLLLALVLGGLDAGHQLFDDGGAAARTSRRSLFGGQARTAGEVSPRRAPAGGQTFGNFKEQCRQQMPTKVDGHGRDRSEESAVQRLGRSKFMAPALRSSPTCHAGHTGAEFPRHPPPPNHEHRDGSGRVQRCSAAIPPPTSAGDWENERDQGLRHMPGWRADPENKQATPTASSIGVT